jgi:hypothetical protein
MYREALTTLTFFATLSAVLATANSTQKQVYDVAQTFVLQRIANGVDGTLELLLDNRLSGSVRRELWGKGEWSFAPHPLSKVYKEFSMIPPGKAKLTIRDYERKPIAGRDLETPLAKLEPWNSSAVTNQLFLVTEDDSAGFGSYNGLVTTLLQVSDGAFRDVTGLNTDSKQVEPIRLVMSIKSDWRRENGAEILTVSCHAKNNGDFIIEYARYSFDGARWLEYTRKVDGLWESDEPFPERSAFP